MKIRLDVGETPLTATLDDTETTKGFASLLPLTLTLEDYASTEKISELPRKLSTKGAPPGTAASAGDVTYYAPWGEPRAVPSRLRVLECSRDAWRAPRRRRGAAPSRSVDRHDRTHGGVRCQRRRSGVAPGSFATWPRSSMAATSSSRTLTGSRKVAVSYVAPFLARFPPAFLGTDAGKLRRRRPVSL